MRKSILPAVLILLLSCSKEKMEPRPERPADKKIEFHLHATQDYSDSRYQGATAEIKIAIYTINYQNSASRLLWDTVFSSRPIHRFPVLPVKFSIQKIFPVWESREKLKAKYNIMYRQNGKIIQQGAAVECVPGDRFLFLDVRI